MMIEREQTECRRCHGTGRVATKGAECAILCSCPAGRAFAAPPIRVFFWPTPVRPVSADYETLEYARG